MGDRTRRAVQRFIGLSRPDRASERHKGGNTEVDIASMGKSPTRRRATGASRSARTKKANNHFVSSIHPPTPISLCALQEMYGENTAEGLSTRNSLGVPLE